MIAAFCIQSSLTTPRARDGPIVEPWDRSQAIAPPSRCLRLDTYLQVMNEVIFPTRLDFGVHAIGETMKRTVRMVCKVGTVATSHTAEDPHVSVYRGHG